MEFSVRDVIMGTCFRLFAQVYLALGANELFLAQVFFGN